ncbi:MAG: hypothetical protein QF570_19350 [Myxococcota bacterium]|nr:hypothetical protein [Myxococcota bacterium]
MAALIGCAASQPIAPVRAPTTDEAMDPVFDEDQRERLDRIREALTGPPSPALPGGLVVRLGFDGAADLDLFVTDPTQESVYFANTPTRSGGTLVDDRRCDDASPRVEAVHFPDPMAGRYRVGVDFHKICGESALSTDERKQGLYIVRVDTGAHVLTRTGMVTPGHFEVIVIEFEVP